MRAREQAGEGSVVPITVRQLEAVVRIAESLAKMTLSPVATEEHVNEAIHLFQVSTLDAASSGVGGAENLSPQMVQQIGTVETLLKRRIAIGSKANLAQIVREFDISHNLPENVVRHAVNILVARDEFGYINQRKRIKRKR
jgi:DNA replication licensing factor MCM5